MICLGENCLDLLLIRLEMRTQVRSWERLEEEITADSLVSGQSYLTTITWCNFIFVGLVGGPPKDKPIGNVALFGKKGLCRCD